MCLSAAVLAAPAAWYHSLPVCSPVSPQIESYTPQLSCTGTLQAAADSTITLDVPVCAGKVYVENGSYVTRGQKLFDVDTARLYKIAALGQDDSLDEESLGQAVSVMGKLSESALWQSVPQTVCAAESGILTGFEVREGSLIGANSTIASILSEGEYLLKLTVPEDRLGSFTPGCEVVFRPVAYPEREYYAAITDKPAQLRRQLTTTGYKNVADIWAGVSAQDEYLAEGLTVTAQVTLPRENGLLTVPYTAVGRDEEGAYVLICEEGKARKRQIETGIELENTVQVTAGLSARDKIAAVLPEAVKEGEWVRWG